MHRKRPIDPISNMANVRPDGRPIDKSGWVAHMYHTAIEQLDYQEDQTKKRLAECKKKKLSILASVGYKLPKPTKIEMFK